MDKPKNGTLIQSPRKSVRFFSRVSVILIPTREEFVNAGLAPTLWHQSDEYDLFKKHAVADVINYVDKQKIEGNEITSRTAMQVLFQPDEMLQQLSLSKAHNAAKTIAVATQGTVLSKPNSTGSNQTGLSIFSSNEPTDDGRALISSATTSMR